MNALIVDDNEIARDTLKQLANHVKDVKVVGDCASALDAYNFLLTNSIDLLLLDIEMPGMTGIELAKNLGDKRPIIIFTTSKKDYAVEAFELNVADYIVKPVTPARFIQSISKARELLESKRDEFDTTEEEFIFIRDSNIIRRIKVDDILFAEAMGDYVKIYAAKQFFAIHATLKALEERLPSQKFLRVHRSYMVAVDKIDTIREGVLVVREKTVPVADAYKAILNKRMNVL